MGESFDSPETREKLYITFHSKDEIERFVALCNEIDDAIDIRNGKQVMDAKSIMGMLLQPLEEKLEIVYACYDDKDDYNEFKNRAVPTYDIEIVCE